MELEVETFIRGTTTSAKHRTRFSPDLILVCVFSKHGSMEKSIQQAMSQGIYATLQTLKVWGPGPSTATDVVVRCDFLPSNSPIFIDRVLLQGSVSGDIANLAADMARQTARCFNYGCLHEYTNMAGNRRVLAVSDIDAAPCFWPVPFDEASKQHIVPAYINVGKSSGPQSTNTGILSAPKCDCGGASVGGRHSSWCSITKGQS